MAVRNTGDSRNSAGVIVLEVVSSGVLIGLAGFFLKAGLLGVSGIMSFFVNPAIWIAGIMGLVGFLAMQKALHYGHVSLVTPIISGISIALPVILAYLLLGESVSLLKWTGLAAIVVGVIGLGR